MPWEHNSWCSFGQNWWYFYYSYGFAVAIDLPNNFSLSFQYPNLQVFVVRMIYLFCRPSNNSTRHTFLGTSSQNWDRGFLGLFSQFAIGSPNCLHFLCFVVCWLFGSHCPIQPEDFSIDYLEEHGYYLDSIYCYPFISSEQGSFENCFH